MTVREQLAKNLAYYRKKAGFTQKTAAETLGTKLTTISSWERGVSQPSADMLVAISMEYRVPLSDLCGMDYKESISPEDRVLLSAFHSADDIDQQMVLRALGLDGGKIGEKKKLEA